MARDDRLTDQERLMLQHHRKMYKHYTKYANKHFDEALVLIKKALDKPAS